MQSIPNNPLLEWNPNALKEIRKMVNLDSPGRIEEAINILEEWIQKQDHFTKKDFSREYLERSLILGKGSVERTKMFLDKLCTMRTLMPTYFDICELKTEAKELLDIVHALALPKMTKDFYRILLIKLCDTSFTEKSMVQFYRLGIVYSEYIKAYDYTNGVMIYDYRNINIGDMLTKINPVVLQEYVSIIHKGYGIRIKGIHLLSQSKAIDLFVKMLKQFLSKKISDRVFVHKTLEDLYKNVPKELLPNDYGGKEKPLEKITTEWVEELSKEEYVKYLKMMRQACTNEELRPADKFNDEHMGMPGSFRNLNVD